MSKFEIYKDNAGRYRFRLKAVNGQVILASQGYVSKSGAENGIESVKKNSQEESQFDIKESSSDKHYFNLVAKNSEIIGSSEMYESKSSMENGIASVMKNAPDAEVVEV